MTKEEKEFVALMRAFCADPRNNFGTDVLRSEYERQLCDTAEREAKRADEAEANYNREREWSAELAGKVEEAAARERNARLTAVARDELEKATRYTLFVNRPSESDEAFLSRMKVAVNGQFAHPDACRILDIALARGNQIEEYAKLCRTLTQPEKSIGGAKAVLKPYTPPTPRFVHCKDCEAWRTLAGKPLGDELRICQIDHNSNRTKYGHNGCCEGIPKREGKE